MKRSIFVALLVMLAAGSSVMAQGPQRRTVEERVKAVHEKIDSAFRLDAAKLVQADSIFAGYYRSSDKVREELRSGGERPDPQVMRDKMQPIMEARDKELRGVLGDDNFKVWKEVIEPSMRPQRPGGGNRG
ncbi:MAG: hypothetical protein ABW019_14650 [Chitinophagaceae bacterium]